jgi:hypothetical protein
VHSQRVRKYRHIRRFQGLRHILPVGPQPIVQRRACILVSG